MIRSLLKLGLILAVVVIGYNYFFGTPEEKAQSERIVGKVRDLGRDTWGLLKSEKAKLKEGKYDGALDKVGNTLDGVGDLLGDLGRAAKSANDSGALDRVTELQEKRERLQKQLDGETEQTYSAADKARMKAELEDLLKETEDLMSDMDPNQGQ